MARAAKEAAKVLANAGVKVDASESAQVTNLSSPPSAQLRTGAGTHTPRR